MSSEDKLIEVHNSLMDFELRGNKKVVGLQLSAFIGLGALWVFAPSTSLSPLIGFCALLDIVMLVGYIIYKFKSPKVDESVVVDENAENAKPEKKAESAEVGTTVEHKKGKKSSVKTTEGQVVIKKQLNLPDIMDEFKDTKKHTTGNHQASTEPEVAPAAPKMDFTPVTPLVANTAPQMDFTPAASAVAPSTPQSDEIDIDDALSGFDDFFGGAGDDDDTLDFF